MKNDISDICDVDIVEIGPGLGDLSVKILDYFDLIAYEIDSELCKYLKNRLPMDRFRLHNKDVLSMRFNNLGWLDENPYILVSNLPYYAATKIILNALKDKMCKGMVVMTQKEVAEKFCASSGEREFCALSVLAQSVSDKIELISLVPPSAFTPMPKVESAIFCIYKNDNEIQDSMESMLKEAFSHPRKKITNNLSSIKNLESILEKLGIDKNARAHQIDTPKYHQIFALQTGEYYGRKQ